MEGNGQSQLMMLLSGLLIAQSGKVTLNGKDITNEWPAQLRREGIGIIPEDRYRQGLCGAMSVSQNLIAGYHCSRSYCRYGIFNFKKIRATRDNLVKAYDIRLSSTDPLVSELSGGNAQKIIIAREFSAKPDLLLASQPTRGVDIGATEFVHSNLLSFRKSGKAILLISSDLSEVMSLSDRIVVMYRGRITGEFDADDVTREELGLYMAGSTRRGAVERAWAKRAEVTAAGL